MKYTHQQVTTIIPFPIIKRRNKSFSRCFENGAKWTCKVIFFFFEAIWFLIEILYILAHVHHIYKGNIWLIDLYILRVNLVPLSSWGAFDLRKITRIFLSIFLHFLFWPKFSLSMQGVKSLVLFHIIYHSSLHIYPNLVIVDALRLIRLN